MVKKLKKGGIKPDLIRMPDDRHMHHKFAIVDRAHVLTGSYNFTNAASTDNWENLVKITNPIVAQSFLNEWQAIEDYRKNK
jgi:phosphatidylserine/phosphatidylglycerophosphate/cardiolipin synthase-like enzyme